MPSLLDTSAGRVATVATFYKASELLGTGRYAEVYKAFDTHHHTDVALKLYVGFDPKAHEMAKDEEGILARLGELNSEYFPKLRRGAKHRIQNRNHPLLVLELGTYVGSDGQKRILGLKDVMPQAGSGSSITAIDDPFWTSDSLMRWLINMTQAVKQLHGIGVIHRDLKPANILIKRSPGQSEAVPFFLDFNSAGGSDNLGSGTGTPRYLPPEVTSGKRREPNQQDDLWAIAMIGWEMVFGQGASPQIPTSQHCFVVGSVSEGVTDALRRALSIKAEERFLDAGEMLQAFEASIPTESEVAPSLLSDETATARSSMERIRREMIRATAPPGEIVVPKDIADAVTTVIAWLSQEDTQSLNLVDEIVRLGSIAFPACLEQGYRLQRDSVSYGEIVIALAKLGAQDPDLAHLSIDTFALSSNFGVRALCLTVCEELGYFPDLLLDSLTADEGILLPDERLKIADLCIRFSQNPTAVLALVKYMCREYILDRNRYRTLCTTIAHRMNELQFPQTALLIWQDSQNCIWEELKDFEELLGKASQGQVTPQQDIDETERGLIELMAEAFATTGVAGLDVLKAHKNERVAGSRRLPIFRRFATKSAQRDTEFRTWLIKEAGEHPADRELKRIVEKLGQPKSQDNDNPDRLLCEYLLSGDQNTLNKLRFWPNTQVLEQVNLRLSDRLSASEVLAIIKLLKGYQTRYRETVIDVVLKHWSKLSLQNYDIAIDVLTAYSVPLKHRQTALDLLDHDMQGPHANAARRGLEKLLL